MTDTLRPEYTAEQVAEAKRVLTRWSHGSGFSEVRAVRCILSEVARLTGVFSQNLDLQMEVESLRSRLERAERDSKRLDIVEQMRLSVEFWIIKADGTLECNVRDPDDEFVGTAKTLRDAIDAASAHSSTPTQGGTNG
jgi:hypothetical protein